MISTKPELATLHELRQHVHEVLCAHDALDPVTAHLREVTIQRAGQACGAFFHEQPAAAPTRAAYAVWSRPERRIDFYTSNGQRFAQTSVADAALTSA